MAELAVVAPLPEPDAPATVLPVTAPPVTAPPATAPASNKKRKAKGKGPAEPASAADALQVKPAAKRKGKGPPAGEVSGSKKPKTGDAGTAAELPRNLTILSANQINQADFKLVKVMQEKQKLSAKIVHSPENLQTRWVHIAHGLLLFLYQNNIRAHHGETVEEKKNFQHDSGSPLEASKYGFQEEKLDVHPPAVLEENYAAHDEQKQCDVLSPEEY